MNSIVNIVAYFDGNVFTNTSKGVMFVCERPVCFYIPYIFTYAQLEDALSHSINSEAQKTVVAIRYRCPVSLFGNFIQYQETPIRNDDDIQQMFRIYQLHQPYISAVELYVDFEEVAISRNEENVEWGESNEGEYEDEYESGDYDANMDGVSNTMAMQHHLNDELSFMRALDLEAMDTPEFPEYANTDASIANGEFFVGMIFNDREVVVGAIKAYSIDKGVDYEVWESKPKTFYCKCVYHENGCNWLVRASLRKNKDFWEIRKYNGPHTCSLERIPSDHSKLDSNMIAEFIEPLVKSDPSLKIKTVIVEVLSRYGYTTTYQKAWAAKQKAIEKVFGNWEHSYEEIPHWAGALCAVVRGSVIQFDTVEAYHRDELMPNFRLFRRIFWSFGPCIKAFRHCKPLIQIDGTHLYEKYKGILLVAVAQDGNQNIVPIGFAVVEGETTDAWHFFLDHLLRYVVTRDGIGIISDCHESIKAAIAQSNGQWEPPRAFHLYCIRHIAANFLWRFKAPNMHRLVVTMGYSRTEREFNHHYQRLHGHSTA